MKKLSDMLNINLLTMVFKNTNITYVTENIVKQRRHPFSLFSMSSVQRQRLLYKIKIWFIYIFWNLNS
mgnify:CR=1 FL=1